MGYIMRQAFNLRKTNWLNKYAVLIFLFLLSLFLFFGCGSSDDSDDKDNETVELNNSKLEGNFYTPLFGQAADGNMWNQVSELWFDSSGDYSYNVIYDSAGSSESSTEPYEVTVNCDLNFPGTDAAGSILFDGSQFIYSDTAAAGNDDAFYIGMGIQKSAEMSVSKLNGDYIAGQIRHDGRIKTARFRFTFDGAGSYSGTILEDTDETADVAGTYAISSDGTLDATLDTTSQSFQGYVSAYGDVFTLLDDVTDDGEVMMMVGVKKPSGVDTSFFNGDFHISQFGGDDSSQWSARIKATADGSGDVIATVLSASDNDVGVKNEDYTVSSDGTLSVTGVGNGIISENGKNIILVDVTDDSYGSGAMLIIGSKIQSCNKKE